MNIYLEIFGYIGTALVLLSMMMTSVVKLRIYNILGSVISMTYSFLCSAWPVVFLNLGLIIINVYQLLRLRQAKIVFTRVRVGAEDKVLQHFLDKCASDIVLSFPGYAYEPAEEREIHMVFEDVEPVGVLIGTREADTIAIDLDYVTKKYRDCSVGNFLYTDLKRDGIRKIVAAKGAPVHDQYLQKMGFADSHGKWIKNI